MIIVYYVLLAFLLLLWFLFVYYFKLVTIIQNDSLIVKMGCIPLFKAKGDRFVSLINNMIPRDRISLEKNIDYTKLFAFIHLDYLENRIMVSSFSFYLIVNWILSLTREFIEALLEDNIKKYNIEIIANNKNDLYLKAKMRFNIGIIVLNIIQIKLRYRNEKRNK